MQLTTEEIQDKLMQLLNRAELKPDIKAVTKFIQAQLKKNDEQWQKKTKAFNSMRSALVVISKNYQTPDQLRKNSEKQYGLDYEESIGMAYENIQATAKQAVKGVKELK